MDFKSLPLQILQLISVCMSALLIVGQIIKLGLVNRTALLEPMLMTPPGNVLPCARPTPSPMPNYQKGSVFMHALVGFLHLKSAEFAWKIHAPLFHLSTSKIFKATNVS